jgi:hypothetical protein
VWVLLGCIFVALAATGYLGGGWALFGVTVMWSIMHTNYTAKKLNHLSFYIVDLLLDDNIRSSQKKHFCEWIRSESAPNAVALSRRAISAIERSAEVLAAGDPKEPLSGSASASTAMIWRVKHPSDTVDPRGPKAK